MSSYTKKTSRQFSGLNECAKVCKQLLVDTFVRENVHSALWTGLERTTVEMKTCARQYLTLWLLVVSCKQILSNVL